MRILLIVFFGVWLALSESFAIAEDAAMKVRSLGINGFEFRAGAETLLIDPYVSRDHRRVSIPQVVRKHIKQADYILLTHSHWDHLADVPEIAKYTDAIIVGSLTTLNICRHYKIAESRLRQYESHQAMQLGRLHPDPDSIQAQGACWLPGPLRPGAREDR